MKRERVMREIRRIKKRINAETAILFGSYARNKADEFSDVDVVFIKREDNRNILERMKDVYLLWNLPIALDALVYTKKEFEEMKKRGNDFIRNVIKDGVEV